jgi:hypothetical protein
MIESGVPLGTIKSSMVRKAQSWNFIDDPEDKRKVLVEYPSLKPQYKELINLRFGNPYTYFSSAIIKQQLSIPESDRNFIHSYKIPDGNNLPLAKQTEYITACSYLNFISKINCRIIRELGFEKATDFYNAVTRLIESDKVSLPTSYPKLLAKARAYKKDGAITVISKKFCNDNSKKVKDEISTAVLLEMISHSNQFEDVFVARKYNAWASQAGYKTITDVTVGNYRRGNLLYVTHSRDGMKDWQDSFGKVITRQRPEYALALINGDDNVLDLAFRVEKKNFERVTLYVIIDAYNDYPLGYSIDHKTSVDGVKAAFLDAIHHIHELTGEYLLWHQLQTDRWALKALQDYYQVIDPVTHNPLVIYTPAKAYNSRSKPIERSFGKDWHSRLRVYNNYTGFNIVAKTKRNWEVLSKRAKDFPELTQAYQQVDHFISTVRTEINERTGKSKQQVWMEGYNKIPADRKRTLTTPARLLHFGYHHSHKNKISNSGIEVTLNRTRINYDIAQEDYLKHIGKTMQVIYDPYDLSEVLIVNDDRRTQVLCPVQEKMKMAVVNMVEGDREKLNVLLKQQKDIGQHVLNEKAKREDTLAGNGIDVHGMLLSPVTLKEDKQLAEETYYDLKLQSGYQVEQSTIQEEELDVFDLQIKNERKAI